MSAEFEFDTLTRREKPVTIDKQKYILREADANAAAKYKSACVAGAKFREGKPTTVDGLGEVEPLLVSLCLFKQEGDKEVPVEEMKVRVWPHRVVLPLFNWVKDNSELNTEKDTVESLEKQISKLQEKLKDLKEDKEGN